jgi:hypothetical protein
LKCLILKYKVTPGKLRTFRGERKSYSVFTCLRLCLLILQRNITWESTFPFSPRGIPWFGLWQWEVEGGNHWRWSPWEAAGLFTAAACPSPCQQPEDLY